MSTAPKLIIAGFSGVTPDCFVVDAYEVDFKTDNPPIQTNMVTKIRGHDVKDISVSILRKLCALFKVSGYRNAKTDLTLAMLAQNKIGKDVYRTLYEVSGGVCDDEDYLDELQTRLVPRKQPHCIVRLLNMLFNDEF